MRRLAILLLLIWLPLQGVAATVMPFCDHTPASAAGTPDGHAGHHGEQPAAPDHAAALACDDCGACHLACAPAVPSHSASPAACWHAQRVQSAPAAISLFVPDQPQRPPLVPA